MNFQVQAQSDTGLYLDGDSQTITNRSGSSPSQLYITDGPQGPEIQLQYRPTVTYATAGLENGQAVNDIRIYIVNLNSSDSNSIARRASPTNLLHKHTINN